MNEAAREFDARRLLPRRRHAEIFQEFDRLAPGEGVVLVDDHDPESLLYELQAERPGAFDWNVLERGPVRCRVELRRRSARCPRGVREFLGGDHRRLDAILRNAARLAHAGAFADALESFGEFRCGLERHIEMEERLLFPAFSQATGMEGGPTVVMHLEHVEIRGLMEEIERSLRGEDFAGLLEGVRGLVTLLGEHNAKEENVLYPALDRALGGDHERDEIVRRMQRL